MAKATNACFTITNTAGETGVDKDVVLPAKHPTLTTRKLAGIVVTPVGGNCSMYDADGNAATLQSGQSYPFEDPNLGGRTITFRAAAGVTIEIINWFGTGQ